MEALKALSNNNVASLKTSKIPKINNLSAFPLQNKSDTVAFLHKYLPDASFSKEDEVHLIEEVTITNKKGYNVSAYKYFFDSNNNGIYGDTGDTMAFKLIIFTSTDGNKVRECYKALDPDDDEIILFLESDKDYLSKDVLFAKMSKKIRQQFTNSDGKLSSQLFDNDIMKVVKPHADIDKSVLEELIKKGYVEESKVTRYFSIFLKYTIMGVSAPAKALGWVLGKLGNLTDYLKISDEFWDTESQGYYFKKDKIAEYLSISPDKLELFKGTFTDKTGFNLANIIPNIADELVSEQMNVLELFTGNFNSYIHKVFKNSDNPLLTKSDEEIAERIALICGIWNGLIDFVSSFFKFFGSLLEAPFKISENFQYTMEMLGNFWDMLSSGLLWDNFVEAILQGIDSFTEYLKGKAGDINWVRLYYFAGFAISFIGTFFIPIADLAKIGEIGKVDEILTKIYDRIGKVLSQTAKFVKIKKAEAYQKISKAMQELLELIKIGGQKLQKFVDDVFKKIADWFLKNKKMLYLYEGNGIFRSRLAEVVAMALDDAPKIIKQYEKAFLGMEELLEREMATILQENGEVIATITDNLEKEVSLSKYLKKLKNAIVTHNHPLGSSLSLGDIMMFIDHGMQELRAIAMTDGTVFSLKRVGNLTAKNIKGVEKAVEIAVKELTKSGSVESHALERFKADMYIRELNKTGKIKYVKYQP